MPLTRMYLSIFASSKWVEYVGVLYNKMATPIVIDIPLVVDASANVTILASDVDISAANFVFNSISTSIDASGLSNALFYSDDNTGGGLNLFRFDEDNLAYFATQVQDALVAAGSEADLTLIGSTDTQYTPTNGVYTGSLGEHFIQYVAAKMFGHPLAQAPINNEDDIRSDIHSADVSLQLYTQIETDLNGHTGAEEVQASVNGLVLSIFETLVAAGRITGSDLSFNPLPFVQGDVLRFIIRMQGQIESGGGTYTDPCGNFVPNIPNLSNIFNYLIDPDYGVSTGAFSHRPLYKVGTDVFVKPKNWVVALEMNGVGYPYYVIPVNQYTAAGTPLQFTAVGNRLIVDASSAYFPPGVDSFVFRRDISNLWPLSETDASYVAAVDAFDDDLLPYSETYIFNAREAANLVEDVSAVRLALDASLSNLWQLYNTDHTAYVDSLDLVPGYSFTVPNGRHSVLDATDARIAIIDVSGAIIILNNDLYRYLDVCSNDTFAKYVNNDKDAIEASGNTIDVEVLSGSVTYDPWYYVPDGNYDMSYGATLFDDAVDVSVGANVMQFFDASLLTVSDPFELAYSDADSDHTRAVYKAATYTAQVNVATPFDISLNDNIMVLATGDALAVATEISFSQL
jgi:hypothetical protein